MVILVDSSFYISQQRAGKDVRHLLGGWMRNGELLSCGIIRAEVLRGVVKPLIKQGLEEFFDLLPEIPTDARFWREVSELAWTLDRTGIVLPLTDLAIARCALRQDATVISHDVHFGQVPGLKMRADLPAWPS